MDREGSTGLSGSLNKIADKFGLYVLRRAGDLIPLERERISLIMKEKD